MSLKKKQKAPIQTEKTGTEQYAYKAPHVRECKKELRTTHSHSRLIPQKLTQKYSSGPRPTDTRFWL